MDNKKILLILAALGVGVGAYYLYQKSKAVVPALPLTPAAIATANAAAKQNNPSVITTVIPSLVTLLDSIFGKKTPTPPTTVTPTGSFTDSQNYSVNPEYVY
jgi:hypothetical protein